MRTGTVNAWKQIPAKIERSISRSSRRALDEKAGGEGWSIRETVHHIVEADLVAATMIIAALGADGAVYDWSWLIPDTSWMHRLGYSKVDVRGAVELLRSLHAHIAEVIEANPRSLSRKIRRKGSRVETISVEGILTEQIEHAMMHLAEIRKARSSA